MTNLANPAKYREAALRQYTLDRLASRVARVESGCLEWQGTITDRGYGVIANYGATLSAHRLAYWVAFGEIPGDLVVDHICFNHRCVEPAHLRLLSPMENAQRQSSALNDTCVHGHPRTPENIYEWVKPNGRVLRHCRTCKREQSRKTQNVRRRRWRAKRRALGLPAI